MAFTDTCKVNFEQTCRAMADSKKTSLKKVIDQLSNESGISKRTMWRWWSEIQMNNAIKAQEIQKQSDDATAKNGSASKDTDNKKDSAALKDDPGYTPPPFQCRSCKRTDVPPRLNGSYKPHGKNSRFYQLCVACVEAMKRTPKTGDGMNHICSHCGNRDKIPWSTVKVRVQKHEREKGGEND